MPFIGDSISAILLGGTGLGQATLSRFFTAHVFLLPAAIVALTGLHLYFFRLQGPAGPPRDTPPAPEKTERFYPSQFFKDTVVGIALIAFLAALTVWSPAPLGPKADPSASFVPRPEWYFLWTFQLLKVMPAFAGAVVVPGVLMTLLALVPFVDRSPYRSIRRRLVYVGTFVVIMGALASLTAYALYLDSEDPLIEQQERAAERFLSEPFVPEEIGKPVENAAESSSSASKAPAPFMSNCAGCHGEKGEGLIGPPLHDLTSKPKRTPDDLVGIIKRPESYGLKGMPAFADMSDADAKAIADWMATLKK